MFGPAGSGSMMDGPCLIEPQVGSLIPRNFLRPRFRFTAPDGHNLFEIRLSTPTQKNDLVVYTIDKTFVMPAEIWNGISARSVDTPITMTIRSGKYDLGSDKLSDDLAYSIVKMIFDRKAELVAVHKEAENIDYKYQLTGNSPVPWHPGALKYFAEKGVKM